MYMQMRSFPDGLSGKEATCQHNVRDIKDLGSISGSGRFPGGGHGNPIQYLAWKPHGQRSLVGYSPQGLKDSDTTEMIE